MKSIIALLFLVCAAQAQTFTMPEYDLGLYNALGFNYEQYPEISSCIQGVYEIYGDIVGLIHSHNGIENTLVSATELIGALSGSTFSDCEAYHRDFKAYIEQIAVVPEGLTLKEAMIKNAKTYPAEVAQNIAKWADYVLTKQEYLAGQTQGELIEILVGLSIPSYPVPEFNYTKYVPFNASTFYPIFYKRLLNDLGFTNQTVIDIFVGCGITIQDLIFDIIDIKQELANATSIEARLALYLLAAEEIESTAVSCHQAIALDLELLVPLFDIFKKSPVATTAHLVFNIVSNLPELKQEQKEYIVAIEEGEYELAGDIVAKQELTAFQGIFNFNLTQTA